MKILVTATNTEVGKTFSSLLFLEEFASRGFKVGAIKPIETGVNKFPEDGKKLFERCKFLNPFFENISIDDVVPIQFKLPASPSVAKENLDINMKKIVDSFHKISKISEIIVVEIAGGLLTPIDEKKFMIDFFEILKLDKVVLISGSELGTINSTLLSIELLKSKNIPFIWAVNLFKEKEKFWKITYPDFEKRFKSVPILERDIKKIVDDIVK